MEKLYNELKTKGETDKSEQAAQLRELLNKTIRDSKEILDRADSSYKEVINNLQTNFDTISQQIEQVVPEQVKSTVKTGFDELRKLIGPKKV
ncbi:MAG: hypothetical protein K8R21_12150 [Leptospira sp.]|nr:hypothetical protein [Leptospira sp.]